ncbi:MAG: hypothetical protein ACR2LC_09520 [Pyrinomonadaceae bacterium]
MACLDIKMRRKQLKTEEITNSVKDSLGVHLWRENRTDEARDVLREGISEAEETSELIVLSTHLAAVERVEGNLTESLRILLDVRLLLHLCASDLLKAKYHNALALTYKKLAESEGVEELFDKAFIEYEQARFYYRAGGEDKYTGYVENNIASLLIETGKAYESHEYLDRARELFANEPLRLAEINDTRAQAHLAAGNLEEAYRSAVRSVEALQDSDEILLLAQSRKTLEIIIAARRRASDSEPYRLALIEADGSVAGAAVMLKLSRQGLEHVIKTRFPELNEYAVRRPRGL